jgi:hypothetical protein
MKLCVVCNEPAHLQIKDSIDYYCKKCGQDCFSSLDLLVAIESEAQRIKNILDNNISDIEYNDTIPSN